MSGQNLNLAIVNLVDAIADLCSKCAEGYNSLGELPDSSKEQECVEDAIREVVNCSVDTTVKTLVDRCGIN